MPSLSSIKVAVREALDVGAGVTAYATIDDLPLAAVDAGEQAFVTSTNRFYIYSGTGWYNIALINTNPSFDSGGGPDQWCQKASFVSYIVSKSVFNTK